jgi:hypothetical protein
VQRQKCKLNSDQIWFMCIEETYLVRINFKPGLLIAPIETEVTVKPGGLLYDTKIVMKE